MPTVVDAVTLAESVFGKTAEKESGVDMIVTPKDIDVLIRNSADLIATSINLSLQKTLNYDELKSLL